MQYRKTNLEILTVKDIEDIISDHLVTDVLRYKKLLEYYKGKNTKILSKPKVQEGNPDNRTPVPFGRKIITTFTGYAYRPKYITYKSEDDDQAFFKALQDNFKLNNEPIKTAADGRNTGIYGVAYELVYVDSENGKISPKAIPRFYNVDPCEIILLYDYSPEPKKKICIHYYPISDDHYKIAVYYKDHVELFDRKREKGSSQWLITVDPDNPRYQNWFEDIPIVPYYFGDDCLGIIEPVVPLIDDYDDLISGSIIEFDRFANAYLRLVKMGIGGAKKPVPNGAQPDNQAWQWLARLRKSRVFENLENKEDVSFLTKDIPKEFVEWMEKTLVKLIHTISSVPDFAQFTDVSGAAVERLMFDFENVVSSAEADFDVGIYERIRLINKIFEITKQPSGDPSSIVITHKRNVAFDLHELAETANIMKQAGFSAEVIAEIMPDQVIPDVQAELDRQAEEQMAMIPDIEAGGGNG